MTLVLWFVRSVCTLVRLAQLWQPDALHATQHYSDQAHQAQTHVLATTDIMTTAQLKHVRFALQHANGAMDHRKLIALTVGLLVTIVY